jgi:hypothetical protein
MEDEDLQAQEPAPELPAPVAKPSAFINVDGVLTSWGYAESNNDDTKVEVPEDFDLEPGKWRSVGDQWQQLDAPDPESLGLATAGSLSAGDFIADALKTTPR